MASPSKLTRKDLAQELQGYISRHDAFSGESYEFNIKLGRIDLPKGLPQVVGEGAIDALIQTEMELRLREFAEDLKAEFPWIHDWAQAGRSGGWLVLQPDEGVGEDIPNLLFGRRRLKDLHKIYDRVEYGLRQLEAEFEAHDIWEATFPEYKRARSRKHWDPREPKR